MNLMTFLRETGRFARVGTMLAKDSVKTRLESPTGISFTEFCYQLLCAFFKMPHSLSGSSDDGNPPCLKSCCVHTLGLAARCHSLRLQRLQSRPPCRQGADFVHLYRRHGVRVQTGGSDQWGNITAGESSG